MMRHPQKRDKPRKFPPGYHFLATDAELIVHYLRRKLQKQPLPYDFIQEVNVYKFPPQQLAHNYKIWEQDGWWFFFTSRDRKHPNGSRPSRTIESSESDSTSKGGWKATGSDKIITDKDIDQPNGDKKPVVVGKKKTLVYYEANNKKTDWIMYEYLDSSQEVTKTSSQDVTKPNKDMKMEGVVLCSIHKKAPRANSRAIVAVPAEPQGELQPAESVAAPEAEGDDHLLEAEAANTAEPSPTYSDHAQRYLLLEYYSDPSAHQLTDMPSAPEHGDAQAAEAAVAESGNEHDAVVPLNSTPECQSLQSGEACNFVYGLDDAELFDVIDWKKALGTGYDENPPAVPPAEGL